MGVWNDEHQMVWEHTNMGLTHLKMMGVLDDKTKNKILSVIQKGIEKHLSL